MCARARALAYVCMCKDSGTGWEEVEVVGTRARAVDQAGFDGGSRV